jgi:hypothetical protein
MLIQTLEGYSCLMIGEREFGTIFRTSHATDTEVILITYNGNQKQSQTLDLGLDSGDTFRAHGTLSDWNLPLSSGSKDWPWLREILTGFKSVRSIIIMPGLECSSVLIDILLFLCRSHSALVPKDRPSVIEVPLIHPYSHVAPILYLIACCYAAELKKKPNYGTNLPWSSCLFSDRPDHLRYISPSQQLTSTCCFKD